MITLLQVFWPTRISLPNRQEINDFLDAMVKRLAVGHTRYGEPKVEKTYMSRMEIELRSYKRSGNREHLFNVANYALLESIAPQHPKHHWNSHIESVTRKRKLI
jgi:hypothetical protein